MGVLYPACLLLAGVVTSHEVKSYRGEIDAETNEIQSRVQEIRNVLPTKGGFSPPHDTYYNIRDVITIMTFFSVSYPDLALRKEMLHRTERNNWPVYYLEIGTRADANGNRNKPVIFIEGLAHACEWIGTASLIYVVDQMLSGFVAQDPTMVEALTNFTWIIIPVVNPDGYVYTWTTDRMWRKNRRHINGKCTGVDLNRNYNVDFGNTGVSKDCYSDVYPGPHAFSESETRNVADLFRQLKDRVVSFLSVHAFSQLLLYPWGYVESDGSDQAPDNVNKLISVGKKMKEALDSNGEVYTLGTAYGVLGYAVSGTSEDWALQEKPGIYAYRYELRPTAYSEHHFILPASQIVPTGQELLQSLLVLADSISEDLL